MGQGKGREADSPETLIDARLHAMYCGVTLSGKTTLARLHARILFQANYDVVVYDPVRTGTAGGDWPEGAEIITDAEKLTKRFHSIRGTPERPVFLFVDEAPDVIGHGTENTHIPRMIRHHDVYLRVMSNRPKMMPPNVRSQMGITYMFRLAKDDARIVAADSGHGVEVYGAELDKGDFLVLVSGSSVIHSGNVFDLVD